MKNKIEIKDVCQLTNEVYVNLFKATYIDSKGKQREWTYASRKKEQTLENKNKADAVVICAFIENNGKLEVILTKEYRVPIFDFEIGFPAGLVDKGETVEQSAIRELKEETGLDCNRVLFITPTVISSAGLSDEAVSFAFLLAEGKISKNNQEENEDIEVFMADRNRVEEILSGKSKYGNKIGAKTYPILLSFIFNAENFINNLEVRRIVEKNKKA